MAALFTVASVIQEAMEYLPAVGNPNSSNTLALQWLNKAHAELCTDCQILETTAFTIALSSTFTLYYPLDDSVVRILSVYYQSGPGNVGWALYPTSEDDLDVSYPSWRSPNVQSQVSFFFTSGNQLGVYPASNLSTTNGYPNLQVYAKTFTPLVYSGNLPSQVQQSDAWLYGLCYYAAKARQPEEVVRFKQDYYEAKQRLLRFTNGRNVRQKASVGKYVSPLRGAR